MCPFYLGIDIHLKLTYMVLMDHTGHLIDERRISNNEIEVYGTDNMQQLTANYNIIKQ